MMLIDRIIQAAGAIQRERRRVETLLANEQKWHEEACRAEAEYLRRKELLRRHAR